MNEQTKTQTNKFVIISLRVSADIYEVLIPYGPERVLAAGLTSALKGLAYDLERSRWQRDQEPTNLDQDIEKRRKRIKRNLQRNQKRQAELEWLPDILNDPTE